MSERTVSFKDAKARFTNRYTMDHVPSWTKKQRPDGTYYAPHYRSDQEWYDNTLFYGESDIVESKRYCHNRNETWPLGIMLDKPYVKG